MWTTESVPELWYVSEDGEKVVYNNIIYSQFINMDKVVIGKYSKFKKWKD